VKFSHRAIQAFCRAPLQSGHTSLFASGLLFGHPVTE
jgi:hypothetical protein